MSQGTVRLLPKVPGVPAASQFRPITLLCTGYKLLTKIICQRLLPLLPTVLTTALLCSVQGRSIFDGILAILSTAEELHCRNEPGFSSTLTCFMPMTGCACLFWTRFWPGWALAASSGLGWPLSTWGIGHFPPWPSLQAPVHPLLSSTRGSAGNVAIHHPD